MPHRSAQRRFDVVLFGATGFVGRQTAAYFAEHAGGLRWAVAGRSADKLAAVLRAGGAGARDAGVVVADAHDAAALDALARDARVVLSTAGPFALYGSELVAACVRHGTHYVDITGETPWVRGLIDRHHAQATQDGTRIVPCCGFDSVPSDLGAWLLTQTVAHRHGQPCVLAKASFSLRGGFNGGTLASALNLMDTGQDVALADPFLLNPPGTRPHRTGRYDGDADPVAPHRDADFDAWLGPFFMGPVNTRVVRRSAALLGYGAAFTYQEYLRFGSGAGAAVAAAGFSAGMGVSQGAMRLGPVRSLVRALAPAPGQGPSEAAMNGGSFRCALIGKDASGHTVRARFADSGDPGNRATTRYVCEAALALAGDLTALPGGVRHGGVLTPASGLGQVLLERLRAAGTTITVDD